jgi:hypothetical protein
VKVQHIANVNAEWIKFLLSAKEYYKSIGIELPKEKSQCIFCGQAIDEQHIDLIELCFQHLDSEANHPKKEIDKKILVT